MPSPPKNFPHIDADHRNRPRTHLDRTAHRACKDPADKRTADYMAGHNTDEATQSTAPRDLQEDSGRGRADRQSIQRRNIPPSRQTNSLHQRMDILERTENLDRQHLPADRGSPDTGSRHSLFLRVDQLRRTDYKNPRSTPQELLYSPMGRTPHDDVAHLALRRASLRRLARRSAART